MSDQRPAVIRFSCPNTTCGIQRAVPHSLCGRRVRCRKCSTHAIVAPSSADVIPSPPSPRPGGRPTRIGRFEILEELGEGAFGTVYRAHDPQLDRLVAVKVPRAGTLTTPKRVERFREDARSAAQLRHPNIVPVHEYGEADGYLFIASDFIEGKTLEETLAQKSLDRRRVVEIVRRLADALAYAHRQGVIHRDVKPSNVLLDAFEEPHLIDFGLAQRHRTTPIPAATDSLDEAQSGRGYIVGTPTYMAPEAASGKKSKATPAMDQYSLGVVLYEALTGRPPFQGNTQMILHQQVHSPIPSPRQTCPDLDPDLEAICLKTLEKKPEDRYANCADLAEDLQRWLKGKIVSARKPGKVERLRRWAFREPMIASLVGAIALSLVLGMTASLAFAWSASLQAKRADENARVAEANARGETEAKEVAEGAERRQRELLVQSRRDQYFDLIARSERELRDRHPAVARQLLHRAWQLNTDRGWEWEYLQAECARTREVNLAPYSLCMWQDAEKNEWLAWARGRYVICRQCATEESYRVPSEIPSEVPSDEKEKQVTAITASPQGKLLAVGYESGSVAIYEQDPEEKFRFRKVTFRYRYASPVTALAVTDDGTMVWGCANGMVARRRRGENQPELCHNWHTGQIRMLQLSPAGDQFVSCCSAPTLRLSSTEKLTPVVPTLESITSGNFLIGLVPGTNKIPGLGLVQGLLSGTKKNEPKPPDGKPALLVPGLKYRVIGRSGGVISILGGTTAEEITTFRQHEADVIRIYSSLGTERVATVDERGVCKLWRILGKETIEQQTVLTDGGFALNVDGSAIAWTEGDRVVKYRIINGATRSFDRLTGMNAFADEVPQSILSYPVYTHELAYANLGENLITGASFGSEQETVIQGELGIWKTEGGSPIRHLLHKASKAHTRTVTATADGQLAWAGDSPTVWLGTTDQRPEDARPLEGHDAMGEVRINVVRFNPDGSTLASTGTDHKLILWDTKQAKAREVVDLTPNVGASLAWSADGKKLYIGTTTGQVLIHDLIVGGKPDHFSLGQRLVPALACDAKGEYLVLGSLDGSISIRNPDDASTAELHRIPLAHRNGVLGLAFSPDGKRLASVGCDQTIRLWEVGTWREALVVPSKVGLKGGIAFHPNGRELAVPLVKGVRLLTSQQIRFPEDHR